MTDKHQFSSTFLNFAASVECCPLAGRPPPRPFFTASGIHWLQCWFCVVWLVNLTFPATSKNAINVALDTFMVPRCCRGLPTSSVISDAYQFKTCYIVVVYLCRHNTDSRNYSDHCWLCQQRKSRKHKRSSVLWWIQELSYRKQIARKLRTQYVDISIGLNITPWPWDLG